MHIKKISVPILILLLIAVNYSASLVNGYLVDDTTFLGNTDRYTYQSFTDYFTIAEGRHYSPIYSLLNVNLFAWFDRYPFILHLINLLLFYGCCLSLFKLLDLLTKDNQLALLATVLFSLHPIHSHSVNIISYNFIWVSFLFWNLSFVSYWKALEQKRIRSLVLSLIFFFISLLSFEGALVLPLCIVFALFYIKKEPVRNTVRAVLPLLAISFIYLGLWFYFAFHSLNLVHHYSLFKQPPGFLDVVSAFFALAFWYGKQLFSPTGIVLVHNILPQNVKIIYAAGGILAAILLGVFIKNVWQRSLKTFALLWGLSGLLLLSVGMFGHLYMGFIIEPHWFTFTSAGFFLLLAYLIKFKGPVPQKIWTALMILLWISFFVATQKYNAVARQEESYNAFWLQHSPDNPIPMVTLAKIETNTGHFSRALKRYQTILEISDYKPADMSNALAIVYINMNDPTRAQEYISKALSIQAKHPQSYFLLGILALKQRDLALAEKNYKEALRLAPFYTEASLELSRLYWMTDKADESVKVLKKALLLRPHRQYLCPIQTQLILSYLSKADFQNGFAILKNILDRQDAECLSEVSQTFRQKGMGSVADQLEGIIKLLE